MPEESTAAPQKRRGFRSHLPWVLILVLAGLAGFWKEEINSIEGRINKLKRFSAESAYEVGGPATEFVSEVRNALNERGIELTLVSMPYREDLYPIRDSKLDTLLDRPDFYPLSTWIALQRLQQKGIRTLDLWEVFRDEAVKGNIYDADLCHLTKTIEKSIGKTLFDQLMALEALKSDTRVTMLGECFADTFGEELSRHTNAAGMNIDYAVLRGSADRGRIPNQMFRFDEIYLDDCDHVIWIVPYMLMRQQEFPPLVTNPPPVGDLVEYQVTLRITEGLGLSGKEMNRAVREMPYPNALAEIGFEVVEEEGDLPDAEDGKGIFLAWAARDRVRSGLEHLREGDTVKASIFEWNAYSAEKPEMVSEFFLRQLNDFERPRFWLQNWVEE